MYWPDKSLLLSDHCCSQSPSSRSSSSWPKCLRLVYSPTGCVVSRTANLRALYTGSVKSISAAKCWTRGFGLAQAPNLGHVGLLHPDEARCSQEISHTPTTSSLFSHLYPHLHHPDSASSFPPSSNTHLFPSSLSRPSSLRSP